MGFGYIDAYVPKSILFKPGTYDVRVQSDSGWSNGWTLGIQASPTPIYLIAPSKPKVVTSVGSTGSSVTNAQVLTQSSSTASTHQTSSTASTHDSRISAAPPAPNPNAPNLNASNLSAPSHNSLPASQVSSSLSTRRPCAAGYVWREATPKDAVCVTPENRAIARQENANSGYHTNPNGSSCLSGYVWREAILDDHVCVTPAEREAVRQ